jgi:hypothetical protein
MVKLQKDTGSAKAISHAMIKQARAGKAYLPDKQNEFGQRSQRDAHGATHGQPRGTLATWEDAANGGTAPWQWQTMKARQK